MSASVVLGVLAFLMFLVTQMIRASLYIAVIGMQDNDTTLNTNEAPPQWSDQQRGIVLGAFYWCYWITELPGGLIAHRYGGRTVLGVGVLCSGLAALVLPISCTCHFLAAAFVRAIQGLSLGVTWPAMHCLAAQWVPKSDRGKFMTTYHGAAIGTAITFPLGGFLVSQLGWSYALNFPGMLCIVWSIFWWRFVYDSPSVHPRISQTEKNYLEKALGDTITNSKTLRMPPWRAVMCSGPFWAVFCASMGLMWGSITLSMQLPAYFHQAHGLNIQTNGLLLGLPEVCKFLFGLGFSAIMDGVLKRELLSITTVRKISVATCSLIPGVLLVLVGWFGGDNIHLTTSLLALGAAAGGASASGSLANVVDISPKYAGTLLGLIKTLCIVPGVVSPMLASYMVPSNDTSASSWRLVFAITSAMYLTSCVIFLIFGSGEEQSWSKESLESVPKNPELTDLMKDESFVIKT